MTGTECEIVFDKACSNYIPNQTLEEIMHKNFCEIGVPRLDAIETAFAGAIRSTLSEADRQNDLQMANRHMGGRAPEILTELKDKMVSDIILPYTYSAVLLSGSTDVGDVSWIVPTAQVSVACNVFGTPGHSWQTVAQGKSGYAHKGMLTAGKIMARTALDVLRQPEVVEKAQAELRRTLAGKVYASPIPPAVKPSAARK